MASQDIHPVDIEAQNEKDSDFDHAAAINRIRSASVVTISPELFEKVRIILDAHSFGSCMSNPNTPLPETFASDSPIPLRWVLWGKHVICLKSYF